MNAGTTTFALHLEKSESKRWNQPVVLEELKCSAIPSPGISFRTSAKVVCAEPAGSVFEAPAGGLREVGPAPPDLLLEGPCESFDMPSILLVRHNELKV